MTHQPPSRLLSTHARVHPPYLPYLHSAASRTNGKSMKWVPPLAAVMCAGYAVASYREAQVGTQLAAAGTEQAEAARRRRDAQMADAYGDRGSLEELERAVRLYEAQQQQQQQQQ